MEGYEKEKNLGLSWIDVRSQGGGAWDRSHGWPRHDGVGEIKEAGEKRGQNAAALRIHPGGPLADDDLPRPADSAIELGQQRCGGDRGYLEKHPVNSGVRHQSKQCPRQVGQCRTAGARQ